MNKIQIGLLILALILAPYTNAVSVGTGQSLEEHKIVKHLNDQYPEAMRLLEKSVNINSGTMNFAGVKAVGMLYKKQFEDIGLTTQWVDGATFNRSGHLLAEYAGNGPKILMIGHLDTVFAQDDEFQKFRPIDERYVAGPGITDMKGGNVIIIEVLRALKAAGTLENLNIKVVMTGDEESSGRPLSQSKAAIIDAAKWADIALGFEDGDSNIKTAVVARRGSVNWKLDVSGRAAHSSQIFSDEVGYGAIFEAARILNEFRTQLAGKGELTFNPGLIAGGTETNLQAKTSTATAFGKNNIVAKDLIVQGGIRALTQEELDNAKTVMYNIVSQNLLHTNATLQIGDGYPPMAPTPGNYQLLELYSQASMSLGYGTVEAVNPRNAGAADISFAASHVEMALDGLGLMGSGGHTKDEVADMDSFRKNMHKAAVLMHRLSVAHEDH